MLRISVTTLEQYRKFIQDEKFERGYEYKWIEADGSVQYERRTEEIECVSEQDLINTICRVRTPSVKMELGTAFHAVLQEPDIAAYNYKRTFGKDDGYMSADGRVLFPRYVIAACLPSIERGFPFEVKRTFITKAADGTDCEIVGMADQWQGNIVNEHKTKWSAFDYDTYANSVQWMWYLLIFGAEAVRYKVFELTYSEQSQTVDYRGTNIFTLREFYGMRKYLDEILSGFVRFVYAKRLENYLIKKE